MFNFIANIFGYLLDFLYNLLNNYGLAIIIFSIFVKLLLLPLTIKQQKTMKKTTKMQEEMKALQFKYKNDPDKLNKEMMDMYKRENMSPFSGCLSSIAQIILILAVFYLVRSPLTYMKKVDTNIIKEYENKLKEITTVSAYPEVQIIKEFGEENENLYINMNFLGLDLSSVPTSNMKDIKTLIIPILYVISSILSTKITMKNQNNKNEDKEIKENENKEESMEDMMQNTTKSMSYMMPVMAFSISLVAPLGLGLYWLMSNILMIVEKICIDNFIIKKEENS